jgi:hypothetical protein
LRVYRLDGTPERDIAMPAMSTLSGRIDCHDAIAGTAGSGIVHFQAESYTAAPSLWRHDLGTGETTEVCPSPVALGPGYLTERVFVERAACWRWRACAAAENMAAPGTKPDGWQGSSRCSTTSAHAPSG